MLKKRLNLLCPLKIGINIFYIMPRRVRKNDSEDEEFEIEEEEEEYLEEEEEFEDEELEEEEDEESEGSLERRACKKQKSKVPLKSQKVKKEHNKPSKPSKYKAKDKENENPQLGKKRFASSPIKSPITSNHPVPFDVNKNYFYQTISGNEWNEIGSFISTALAKKNVSLEAISSFFQKHPKLFKGEQNNKKLLGIINSKVTNKTPLSSYQQLITYILDTYYIPKPSIFEVHFFPNPFNELYVLKMLSTCKVKLDIAIFTMTNQSIADTIADLFKRGVKVRIIADCECCKMGTSNIYQLAAIGIPTKTDDSVRYFMHHKFCVIDESVVVTGSFNWTTQAVKNNQENVLFLENKKLAMKYAEEFQRLWEDFETVVTRENANRIIKEREDMKKAIEIRKNKIKEAKMKEKGEDFKPRTFIRKVKEKEYFDLNKIEDCNILGNILQSKADENGEKKEKKWCSIF